MDSVDQSMWTALRATWLVSGTLVFLSFLYSGPVGSLVTGRVLLAVALTFFGSSLLALSAMPAPEAGTDSTGSDDARPGDHPGAGGRLLRPVRRAYAEQEPVVVGVTLGLLCLVVGVHLAGPAVLDAVVGRLRDLLLVTFGRAFLWVGFLSVGFCLAIVVGPWGDVRLGGPDAEPEYSLVAYVVVVFTAGIAAGLVLSGSTDVLSHYKQPPPVTGAEPYSARAVVAAMEGSMLHWGISTWSLYGAVGVPIAYFAYERGAPLRPAAALAPVFGADGLDGTPARLVDAMAIFAVLFGVASSLATVTDQFLAGVAHQWEVHVGGVSEVLFVAGVTVAFTAAAVSGFARGIRRIATVTALVFVALTLLVFVQGPTGPVVRTAAAATAGYLAEFPALSLAVRDAGWRADWTAFYWSWWLAWAGFAGLLLAGLSKGRTLRTVVLAGVVAPTVATLAWVVVIGGVVLEVQHGMVVDLDAVMRLSGTDVAAYPVFDHLLLGRLMVFLLLAVVVTFVVASADTATLTVAVAAARSGRAPSAPSVVFWGGLQGAVTAVMVAATDTGALRTLSALAGGPVAVLAVVGMAGTAWSLWRR